MAVASSFVHGAKTPAGRRREAFEAAGQRRGRFCVVTVASRPAASDSRASPLQASACSPCSRRGLLAGLVSGSGALLLGVPDSKALVAETMGYTKPLNEVATKSSFLQRAGETDLALALPSKCANSDFDAVCGTRRQGPFVPGGGPAPGAPEGERG